MKKKNTKTAVENENMKIIARIRRPIKNEKILFTADDNNIIDSDNTKRYAFDFAFDKDTGQVEIF